MAGTEPPEAGGAVVVVVVELGAVVVVLLGLVVVVYLLPVLPPHPTTSGHTVIAAATPMRADRGRFRYDMRYLVSTLKRRVCVDGSIRSPKTLPGRDVGQTLLVLRQPKSLRSWVFDGAKRVNPPIR
jgi:hypothetical protein